MLKHVVDELYDFGVHVCGDDGGQLFCVCEFGCFDVSVESGEAYCVVGDEVLEFSYDFASVDSGAKECHPHVVSSVVDDCSE